MIRNKTLTAGVVATAAVIGLATASLSDASAATAAPAAAASAHHAPATRIAVHFDLAKGQTPENIALGPDGTAYLTFAKAWQVAKVTPDGRTHILATLPTPANDGKNTPKLGFALATGIVRLDDGTIYVLFASGDPATTGLYRLRPGSSTPVRITALPAQGFPNGLALDGHTLYITDSVLGAVFTVPLSGGPATVWSSAPELAPVRGFLGANGIKVHDGAVWVTNLDAGTLLRIPLDNGRAGGVEVKAASPELVGIDDFAFFGSHAIVALNNPPNRVVDINPATGQFTTVLSAADGLQNPTSVAVRGNTAYVISAAYFTLTDPNLILTTLESHHE